MKSTRVKTPLKYPAPKAPRLQVNQDSATQDPVQVYCRIRPMQTDSDLSCLKLISPQTVAVTPPEMAINYKISSQKETQYTFKHVFDTKSRQNEVFNVVAQPLVEALIRGKNGLLFTYGVTSSGKTYTMMGNSHQRGIMPRCMDILFKTIADYQTMKYIFKPDRLNGFEIQTEADAMLERQQEMNSKFSRQRKVKDSDSDIASQASADVTVLNGIEEDNMYAVFVTFVEVYNNSVYDLLEDGPLQKTLQTKIVREDSHHNMFVHGVTEVEVKSVQDVLETFQLGQKRKRMGHTILNAESSRSHVIFTIRLVQAPTDKNGEHILQDKRVITVSQLSLVDLAGSERTNRTKNTGERLREAGNINNSLMTLRNCLEILRENQSMGAFKKVPYRESKLTHIFKNYFEGEGQVRMVVCVNPRAEDYDETAQVMKFAEITQEVQVARPTPQRVDMGLTPGRRKANNIFKLAINNLEANGNSGARALDFDMGLVYSLGPNFPDLKLNTPDCDRLTKDLMRHLEHRIEKRKILLEDFNARQDKFRALLIEMQKENISLKMENSTIKAMFGHEKEIMNRNEAELIKKDNMIANLTRTLRDRDDKIKEYQRQINEKQQTLNEKEIDNEKIKRKYATKIAVETEKINRKYDEKLKSEAIKLKEQKKLYDGKLKLVSDIISADKPPQLYRSSSSESIPQTVVQASSSNDRTNYTTRTLGHVPRTPKGVPVANIRHRRSRSTGERWLEHRAPNPVPLGTILQPYLKNRKSITKLTDAHDLSNNKITNYCLIDQEADTEGEVETKLYKGNVIPTTGGGAQVIFNDIECLKQMSPNGRKRSSNPQSGSIPIHEVTSKCSVGIEGHSHKKPRHFN